MCSEFRWKMIENDFSVRAVHTGSLNLLPTAVVESRPKLPREMIWFVSLTYTHLTASGERQGRNSSQDLEVGTEAESSVDGDYWLTLSGLFTLSIPFAQQWHLSEWARASSINSQPRKCPVDMPTDPSGGDIFSTEVSLPKY